MKIVKSILGMSLIEMLIVLGVMGVITAGAGAVILQMQKATNTIEAKQDLNALVFDVQTRISSNSGCKEALGIDGLNDPGYDDAVASRDSNGSGKGLPVPFLLTNGELMQVGSATKLSNYKLNANNIFLYDAENAYLQRGIQYKRVNIIGEFEAQRVISGTSQFRRSLGSLFIGVDAGKITDCVSTNTSDDESMSQLCEKMGMKYDEQAGKCKLTAQAICEAAGGTYSPSTQQCEGGPFAGGTACNCKEAPRSATGGSGGIGFGGGGGLNCKKNPTVPQGTSVSTCGFDEIGDGRVVCVSGMWLPFGKCRGRGGP
ncbi:MAG: type II secretion system protein [Bdellovibrionales bacterium]|nr:type II secretion system protein [Bdellovibrionales bacterium]